MFAYKRILFSVEVLKETYSATIVGWQVRMSHWLCRKLGKK